MGNFDHNYTVCDDFGVKELKCMCCGAQIGGRTYTEVPSRTNPAVMEKVMTYGYHSNIRFKEIELSDNSVAQIMICQDCVNESIDKDKVMNQIKVAWEDECTKSGLSADKIKKHKDRIKDLKILKVATEAFTSAKVREK